MASVTLHRLQASTCGNTQQRLQSLFGLSGKEAELACALIEGYSLQEAADQRAFGITTVRTPLSSQLRKTGTPLQRKLIAPLAPSSPPYQFPPAPRMCSRPPPGQIPT